MSLSDLRSEIVVHWIEADSEPTRQLSVSLPALCQLVETLGLDSRKLLDAWLEHEIFAPKRKRGG